MADPKTQEEIQSEIIEAILERDDSIATDVGQPLRTIAIDPVAEVISRAYGQDYKTRLSQDIDNLSGDELDNFLSNFGFSRIEATRARGTLTFSRSTPADTIYFIPYGTRAFTVDGIYFRTTTQAILLPGDLSVDIPAEAEVAGSSGNVAKNTIILSPPIAGFSSVTNAEAFSGGKDMESDDEVKIRFKRTVLKNVCGTKDHYIGIPYEFDGVSNCIAVSPAEFFQEFTEFENISPGTTGAILALSSEYVYENSVFVQDKNKTTFFTKNTDWVLEEGIPQTNGKYWIRLVPGSPLNDYLDDLDEKFVWVSYDYKPNFSRGPGCVEVMIVGGEEGTAKDVFKFSSGTSRYYFTKRPVSEITEVIKVGGANPIPSDYYELEKDTSNANRSTSAADNIRFISAPPGLSNGDLFQVIYSYNQLVENIQKEFRTRKQVTADVLVHEGIPVYLDVKAKIMIGVTYSTNVEKTDVDTQIFEALEEYLQAIGFGPIIQFSDLEYFSRQNSEGLDNIEIVSITATPESPFDEITEVGGTYTKDFLLDLNQYPVLNSLSTDLRSFSTWGD